MATVGVKGLRNYSLTHCDWTTATKRNDAT